ncbi:MAG: glycosyltransferase family A protein [Acholeplasma sp.]|nr:glycosyltransferase family A protein [Acholeplasma sp.]
MERISVIIPLYNKEKYIAKAIESVLCQTYTEFELIVVNDGSTDRSEQIVRDFDDQRIRFYTKENGGVSSARNFGIEKAKFEYIAFLDGDDWWDLDFLSTMVALTRKCPEAGLYGGQYVQVNSKNETIKLDRFPPISDGYFKLHEYLFAIWSSSIVVRKHVFKVTGGFDENLTHGEDLDMWIRVGLKFEICYTNKVVAYYNIAGNPLTKSTGKIPAFNNHLLSKIDNYFGIAGDDFDSVLMERKVKNLRIFYIQYPFNPIIKQMIKTLPSKELKKDDNKIFTRPFLIIYFKHILFVTHQSLLKIKNLIFLKIIKK